MTIAVFTGAGCAVGLPLDANMRIDVDAPAAKYSQSGKAVDGNDMLDKLGAEPENSDRVSSAKTMATVSILLSGLGGGAIGWPLGEYAVGKDPHWWMAGVGAGLLAIGLPLAFAGDARIAKAVEVHNELIDARQQSDRSEWRKKKETAAVREKAKPLPPLPEGFGFAFDKGPEEAGGLCRAVGYEWSEKDGTFLCSGVPTSEIKNASAELSFADGRIASLRIFVQPKGNAGSWATAIKEVETTLERTYGKPTQRDFSVASDCAGEAFVGCVRSGKVAGRSSWSKNPERSVTMAIADAQPQPRLVVDIARVRAAAAP